MYMVHRNKLFNKSVKNKDRYIPEGYNQRILNILGSLPDTMPEDIQNVCIVKHSRTSTYTTALSAAAVIMLVMGSVYAYTNIASSGKDHDNDPQITITTVTTVTTDKSGEKNNNTTISSYEERITTSVSENTTTSSGESVQNHDIAGNTDINTAQTYQPQTSVKKQITSAYDKKETEKAAQTTKVKTTDKAESKTAIKETKKAETKQTAVIPDHAAPDNKKPVVTAPPAVIPPVPPVHTKKENEKPDNDRHENNKDFSTNDKQKELPDKNNGRIEEEKTENQQNCHSFENVKEVKDDKCMNEYDTSYGNK